MGKQLSLQDLIRGRQQSGFVGRQRQIVQFQENLGFAVDDERRRFLFNIHGDAGVGKTYLTKQLVQIARDDGALTAYVDESVDDAVAAMAAIARAFTSDDIRLAEFEKRVAAYRKRRREFESDPQAPDNVASFLTKAAVTIGFHVARDVPFAGSLLAPIDPAIAAEEVDQARAYLVRKLGDHADVRLLLSPVEELTPIFATGLERVSTDRYVALFFDTYERTAPILDRWLRDLYTGRYGGLPVTLVTTISGQNPLNPNLWGEYLPVIADVPLEPFSEAEARQFLASKNIIDEPTIQVILNLSGRLPMWLTTLAEARPNNPADIGDPAGNAVERFLKWEDDPTRRAIAVTAALPRNLNQDMLAIIGPSDKASKLFEWLCRLPFISRQGESWKYHEVVRSAMLRLQRAQSPNEWRVNHTALAQANAQWAKDAAAESDQAWKSPDWIDRTREEIYHLLCANPINNLPLALASAVKAAEHSTARARQWADLLMDAGSDTDNLELSRWGRRLRDGIRDSNLTQYLSYLIDDAQLDNKSLVIALEERGETHRLSDRNDAALADFNRALELDPDDAWALGSRGQVYLVMQRYDEALADFGRAAELKPSYRWVASWRGFTYLVMRRYDDALADFNRALELDPDDAWTLDSRGRVYMALKRYDEALADFSRALELDPDDASIVAWRGETYRLMERYDEAVADLNRALELNPDDPWTFDSRGQVYMALKRYDKALADLNRALELNPDAAWALDSRGQVYMALKRYDKALADFSRALELNPDDASIVAWRGETYRLMERYDEALADLNRALELDPNDAWTLDRRRRVYLALKRYDDALADLNRALELDPDAAWALDGRGLVYLLTQRYEDALADFSRALELNPDAAWALDGRGLVYLLTQRYEDALADFSRAAELDSDDASAIAWRGFTHWIMRHNAAALADLALAKDLDPEEAEALAVQGETHRLMGRYDEAVAELDRAKELDFSVTEVVTELLARMSSDKTA
jgi:tetratricopeptide (TPR) repeat protein